MRGDEDEQEAHEDRCPTVGAELLAEAFDPHATRGPRVDTTGQTSSVSRRPKRVLDETAEGVLGLVRRAAHRPIVMRLRCMVGRQARRLVAGSCGVGLLFEPVARGGFL